MTPPPVAVETRRASGSVNPSDCLPSHISSTVAAWTISGQVPVDWQRGWTAGVRSEFAEMTRYLTTGKRVAYIRLRPVFATAELGATNPPQEAAARGADEGEIGGVVHQVGPLFPHLYKVSRIKNSPTVSTR